MPKTISVNHRTFQTLAIQSLRYCMGRMTYAVSDCADFIRQHWQDFSQNTKNVIIRDLDIELESHEDDVRNGKEFCRLGHDCDYRTWKSLREWINEQPSES
ncbi:preprotein translocase subunit SecG [Actinobacillus porcinus]|uniref:preprotein translocase subunit SecG n=1 Tax=Actinobacillus porcinus TaxID=51048 RepID=UPI0023536CE7|nr:preprotein translocase subunit SecG [Actinobacillus porcinus]